jgi:hypothetical protein
MTKISKRAFKRNSVVLLCCAIATGCAVDPKTGQPSFKETFNSDDPCSNNSRNIGLVAGTVLGAVLGHQIDKKGGALVGAGAGALVGGLVGRDMDRKKCELSKLAKKYALEMTFTEVKADGGMGDSPDSKSSTTGYLYLSATKIMAAIFKLVRISYCPMRRRTLQKSLTSILILGNWRGFQLMQVLKHANLSNC